MLDELFSWDRIPPVIVTDADYGDSATFHQSLTDRELVYVVAVKGATLTHRARRSRSPPRIPVAAAPHSTLSGGGDLQGPRARCRDRGADRVEWGRGTKTGPANPQSVMRSRFVALRVRPANRTIPRDEDGVLPPDWLRAEWPVGAAQPIDLWLSTLSEDTPLSGLVRLARIRWRVEHDYRELKTGFGFDHFEGRSWLGWHHHVTLVTTAHLFLTTLRLTDPQASGQD